MIHILLITFLAIGLIGLVVCSIGIFKCVRDLRRNNEVYEFRQKLLELAHNYNIRHIELPLGEISGVYKWFVDKWTYDEMLKSRKSLTLEAWYTPEEIKKINA